MAKTYEILEALPTSGPMYIPVTEDGDPYYSTGFVVRFFKLDGTNWVANFRPGIIGLSSVFELPYTRNILVISNGLCYLMDPGQTEPISVFGGQFLKSYETQDGKIILEDYTRFTIVEKDGSHWHTERISWDGFDEVKIEGDVISGLSYRPTDGYSSWHSFSYNIYSRVRTGGAYP